MDRTPLQAALLSGLVFPGVGQWYLGRRVRALLFLVPAAGAAWYFGSRVWGLVELINADIAAGRMGFDPLAIAERVHQQAGASTEMMNYAALTMLACWIGSIADALIHPKGSAPKN